MILTPSYSLAAYVINETYEKSLYFRAKKRDKIHINCCALVVLSIHLSAVLTYISFSWLPKYERMIHIDINITLVFPSYSLPDKRWWKKKKIILNRQQLLRKLYICIYFFQKITELLLSVYIRFYNIFSVWRCGLLWAHVLSGQVIFALRIAALFSFVWTSINANRKERTNTLWFIVFFFSFLLGYIIWIMIFCFAAFVAFTH